MRSRYFCLGLVLTCLAVPAAAAENEPGERQVQEEFRRGIAHFEKGNYDAAIESFRKVAEARPNFAQVYSMLGVTYMRQNQSVASAIGSFEHAIQLDPRFGEAYFNLASIYASGAYRDPAKALQYFRKTLEIDPNYKKAYFGLAWFTLTQEEDAFTAEEYFQKAIAYAPDFAEAHYGLGLSYVQMGKNALALGPISTLRALNREDLASLLESAIRGEPSPSAEAAGPESETELQPAEPGGVDWS
jgi:tetratricopeptide (TPR) repeat protein